MKKLSFLLISLLFSTFLFNMNCSSDNDNEYEEDNFTINLSPEKISAEATTSELKITTTRKWNISIEDKNKSWVSFSSNEGVSSSTVSIIIEPNKDEKTRIVDISVSNGLEIKTVRLIQEGFKEGVPLGKLGWLELPKQKNMQNTLFISHKLPDNPSQRNYSMLYDTQNKIAYWVAYPLHKYYIGKSGRTDAWNFDPQILQEQQSSLFKGIPGFDRGHQIPSADRTNSKNNNKTTFYFSNMTPQNSILNQNLWANLEKKVRTWSYQCDTLYVVTGAIITTATDPTINYAYDNNKNKIAVPKYYYKALLKRNGNIFTSIAYKMNNEKPVTNTNIDLYKMTVSELEKETGFTFFPKIPEAIKNEINPSQWK